MRGRIAIVLVGCLAVTASACSSTDPDRTPTAPTITYSSPTPSPTPPRKPPRPNRDVTIAFGGDVHFEGSSAGALSGGMAPISPWLRRADLAMVNLETAITERGTPEPKEYTFRAPATAFTALRDAGVDVVNLANNHGKDFGAVGFDDTLAAARRADFPMVGAGRNDKAAWRPWRTTVRGQRIAVLGASQVIDSNLVGSWTAGPDNPGLASAYDEPRLLAAVRAARRSSDVVVVFLHWGSELVSCPTTRQRNLAPALVRAGADVVVGSHAHVLLGGGYLDDSFVHYGLGNFVFYSSGTGPNTQTGVLTLTVRRHEVADARWDPAMIQNGVPVPLSGSTARTARNTWRGLRDCTGLDARPEEVRR